MAAGAHWPDSGPIYLRSATWLQVDGSWNPEKPKLSTCDPLSMKFVTDQLPPQEVKEGKEIVFTYDVSFKVSLQAASRTHRAAHCSAGLRAGSMGQ